MTADAPLEHLVRPAAGDPEGLLMLLHGRGADQRDLVPLLDALDPERRLLGVTPRGPLSLPPGGAHWYVVRRLGYPDPETFGASFPRLTAFLDAVWRETGIPPERTVVGGFSQGAVMSYALSLAAGRPRPAGLIALSGFMPTVEGLDLVPPGPGEPPRVAVGHGTHDPVIGVEFGREARRRLEASRADLLYRESPMPHTIDPAFVADLRGWLRETVAAADRLPRA